ncbi:MAG: enoyl-CoA hydratase [Bacteroidetes bacterium]|nr:enoyl-CoA hydratase [Bacteroidota bacterium]
MPYQFITIETSENIATITINRADKLNALNATLLQEIKSAVETASSDSGIYGIILTGAGDKAFAAGADIAEFVNFSEEEAKKLSRDGHNVMNAIENSGKPTIAVVKGFALGGGCELAMACHFRYAGESAKFGQPEINLGLVPGYGGTQRMIRLVGRTNGLEILCSARMVDAEEAFKLGLVNKVFLDSEVMNEARNFLKKLFSKSPQAMANIIKCVNLSGNPEVGFEKEIELFGVSFTTSDFKEGTSAFLEKRKANFRS